MTYDKIKIYVTPRVGDILSNDADSFEFYKSDGVTPNKNGLLTRLIVNYSQEFNERQERLYDRINCELRKVFIDEQTRDNLCNEIANKVNKELSSDSTEKFNRLISLKPTKETAPLIEYAENYLLKGASLSEYYRNMFTAYASFTQDKREEIIFKENYDLLSKAINEGKKVFITTRAKARFYELSPYAFARSKEEMHVYLLTENRNRCRTIRLSRIESVVILKKAATFTEKAVATFKKMQEYGPQFYYLANEEEIVIKLTKEGVNRYRKIYVHRPIPKRIEGDLYYFDCSANQVVEYFKRFGDEAYVVSPPGVRESILSFHYRAVKAYRGKSNSSPNNK